MDSMKKLWLDLAQRLILDPHPLAVLPSGVKYFGNVEFILPGKVWAKGFDMELHALGYKTNGGRSTKMAQLTRNYFNPESIVAAKEKLWKRIVKKSNYTSVLVDLTGQDKDSRSQGHCMSSMVITHIPKNLKGEETLTIDVYYRITEAIKKFGADLLFLTTKVIPEVLPPQLNVNNITEVRFHFSNIYFSPFFLPVLIPEMDVIGLLRKIKASGLLEVFESCHKFLSSLKEEGPHSHNYSGRTYMYWFLHEVVKDKDEFLRRLNNVK